MTWEGKHIVWTAGVQRQRKKEMSLLSEQGASFHVFSGTYEWTNTDMLITDSVIVPDVCIPVIRTSPPGEELGHDSLPSRAGPQDFIGRISRWKEARQSARRIDIDHYPIVNEDITNSLRRLAGPEVLRIGREKFLSSSAGYLRKLEKNKNQPDWEEITKLLHTLKGSSGTIGAMQVSAASRAWEDQMEQHTGRQDFGNQLYLLKMLLEYFRYHTLSWG